MENNCDMCDGKMSKEGEKIIGTTTYNILVCDKCRKQVMRRDE